MKNIGKLSDFHKTINQQGQALLVVILVMVIALTVGLSIASRTITSLRNSTEVVKSQKALTAAEAGIEQALKSNGTTAQIKDPNFSQDSNYTTDIVTVSGKTFLLSSGNYIPQDDGIDLWLSNYSANKSEIYTNPWSGNFTLYWGTTSDPCSNSALEIVVISGPDKNNPSLKRYAYDPCDSRINGIPGVKGNNFTKAELFGSEISGKRFYFSTKVINVSNGFIARIVPLYANTIVAVNAGNNDPSFPPQGYAISSQGTSGEVVRKVNVFQGFPQIPAEYYLYNLFLP